MRPVNTQAARGISYKASEKVHRDQGQVPPELRRGTFDELIELLNCHTVLLRSGSLILLLI
jgi:hypothetical protein